MPEVPRMPPSRRVYARIDRLECECPHCGRLIFAGIDKHFLPTRLQDRTRARSAAKQRPRAPSVMALMWNPYLQRLKCPWCDHVYTVGVAIYPVPRHGGPRYPDAAPDIVPTPAEVAELRRLAGGWFVKGGKRVDAPANLLVYGGCTCQLLKQPGRTDPRCPMHGEETLNPAPVQGGESA